MNASSASIKTFDMSMMGVGPMASLPVSLRPKSKTLVRVQAKFEQEKKNVIVSTEKYVDTHPRIAASTLDVVIDEPGEYQVICPKWAKHCIISAAAGGQGGAAASIDSATGKVASGAGGASGETLSSLVLTLFPSTNKKKLDISVGEGGAGGTWKLAPGNGGNTAIGDIITLRGGGSAATKEEVSLPIIASCPGQPGACTFGSEGTPRGGNGAGTTYGAGGKGGSLDSSSGQSSSSGQPGALGGAGGGGASPYGDCTQGSGGKGGDGFVRLEFPRPQPLLAAAGSNRQTNFHGVT